MRCDRCAPITISSLREVKYRHHRSFQALVASADRNCDLCRLLRISFETGNNTKDHVREILEGRDVREHPITLSVDSNDIDNDGLPPEDRDEFKIYTSLGPWQEPMPLCSPESDLSFDYTLLPDVRVDHDHEAAIKVMSKWIDRCSNDHGDVCQGGPLPLLPTRVIDVGSNENSIPARVVETNGSRDKYVILSYCWGPDPQLKSTADLMDDHKKELKLHLLSQTVQDAITLTRKLGFRYLWVDALCIVQAGPGESVTADFLREAPKMKLYYGNASLTIMVEAAGRCQEGFLKRQPGFTNFVPLIYDRPSKINGPSPDSQPQALGTVFAYNCCPKNHAPWSEPLGSRAWTLQENVLSRRKLAFGSTYMRYECESAIFMESGEGYSNLPVNSSGASNSPKTLSQIRAGTDRAWRRSQALKMWYGTINSYDHRQITNKDDMFAAMEGLVGAFDDLIESRYIWGIWECDMMRGLMWRRDYTPGNRTQYQTAPARKCSVSLPSWSWISLDCPKEMAIQIQTKSESSDRLFAPDNICATLLNLEDIDSSREPIRSPKTVERVRLLKVRGKLMQLRRSTQSHIIPYRSAGNEDFKRGVASHLCLPDKYSIDGPDSDKAFASVDKPPVASAILDNGTFEDVHSVWCLPLVIHGGILLKRDENHKFRRVGLFWVVDQSILENVPLTTVDII